MHIQKVNLEKLKFYKLLIFSENLFSGKTFLGAFCHIFEFYVKLGNFVCLSLKEKNLTSYCKTSGLSRHRFS
jgi:hypothetical protein